jgi:hypothetical protein
MIAAKKTAGKKIGPKKGGQGGGKKTKPPIEHVVIIVKENLSIITSARFRERPARSSRVRPIPRLGTRTTGTTRG